MFYRMRFDGWIGGMLRISGLFSNTAESVNWWPAGSTARWVEWGKSQGLNPADAACLALAQTVAAKLGDADMDREDADQLLGAALLHARQNASREVHARLLEIITTLNHHKGESV